MIDVEIKKENNPDCGPMPRYSDAKKPLCIHCKSFTWVVPTGNDGLWRWYCTNCTKQWEYVAQEQK